MPGPTSDLKSRSFFVVRNTTEEWIPAGALLRPISTDPATGDVLVGKPNGESLLGLVVNGLTPIAPAAMTDENRGQATADARCVVLCAEPAAGDPNAKSVSWGYKNGF